MKLWPRRQAQEIVSIADPPATHARTYSLIHQQLTELNHLSLTEACPTRRSALVSIHANMLTLLKEIAP